MNAMRRRLVWPIALLTCGALLLQGCGATAKTQKAGRRHSVRAAASFREALPALDAVQFLTPKLGFIAGNGIVLETRDGGNSWTRIYQGQKTISAIDFTAADAGLALEEDGQVLAWDGRRWQAVFGGLGPAAAVHLAQGGATTILTAAGDLYGAPGPAGPYSKESLSDVTAVSFAGAQTGWAVTGGPSAFAVWVTRDGGQTWSRSLSTALSQRQGWTAALAASGSAAWLLLTSNQGQMEHQPYVVYANQGYGQSWQEPLAAPLFAVQGMYPSAQQSLFGLQAGPFAAQRAAAVFVSWQPGPPSDLLALTTTQDGGQSWRQLPIRTVPAADIPAFFSPMAISMSGTSIWLVGSRAGSGRVLESIDGGVSWSVPAF